MQFLLLFLLLLEGRLSADAAPHIDRAESRRSFVLLTQHNIGHVVVMVVVLAESKNYVLECFCNAGLLTSLIKCEGSSCQEINKYKRRASSSSSPWGRGRSLFVGFFKIHSSSSPFLLNYVPEPLWGFANFANPSLALRGRWLNKNPILSFHCSARRTNWRHQDYGRCCVTFCNF